MDSKPWTSVCRGATADVSPARQCRETIAQSAFHSAEGRRSSASPLRSTKIMKPLLSNSKIENQKSQMFCQPLSTQLSFPSSANNAKYKSL